MMTSAEVDRASRNRHAVAVSDTASLVSVVDRRVGGKILAARNSAGMTLDRLAERTRIVEARLTAFERGSARPAGAELIAIVQALQVQVSDLF